MSIKQILKSRVIICTVPDKRKAKAVKKALQGPVTPEVPASILQTHSNCHFFLDAESAALARALLNPYSSELTTRQSTSPSDGV